MVQKAIGVLALLAASAGLARGAEPTEALTVRLVRPDQQLERLIGLFEGTRAAHPAAALAAWKRANGRRQGLGKAREAAIAALNPGMVRELRSLDEARGGLGLDPLDGHTRWYAVAPGDDGSFAALASALILTDGGPDLPHQGVAVDRLGPPGSALVARVPGTLILAGSRADLPAALKMQAGAAESLPPSVPSGLEFRLDPAALAVAGPVARRRLAEAIRGAGVQAVEGTAALEGETVRIAWTGRLEAAPGTSPIEPGWLDWIPADGTLAAVAVTLDPGPHAWDAAFAWADRVEKADPARAQVAPLRARLNVLALAARVRPEIDLWPRLRGLTAFVAVDPQGEARGAVVALHATDETSAERLAAEVLPRLAASFTPGSKRTEPAGGTEVGRLALISGRPLEAARRGSTVVAGWGEGLVASSLAAHDDPAHSASAGASIRRPWADRLPHRAGAFWPGRLGNPLLAEAPPVVWLGRNDGAATHDLVLATGLHGVVRRLLDRLPLDPPAPADEQRQ